MRRYQSVRSEATLQRQVCDYLRMQYPNAIFRSDFASGMKLSVVQAVNHKYLQSSRGWVDLLIYEPVADRQGLAIELKAEGVIVYKKNGEIRADAHLQEQAAVLEALRQRGYEATFAVGWDEAKRVIDEYFGRRTVI